MHNERCAEYAVRSVTQERGTDEPRNDNAKQQLTRVYVYAYMAGARAAAYNRHIV